jgi:hypothetical protein
MAQISNTEDSKPLPDTSPPTLHRHFHQKSDDTQCYS